MSTLKVNTVLSADTPTVNITDGLNVTGVSTVTTLNTTNIVNSTALSHRNLIINGAMQVAQRGTSSTVAEAHVMDRFKSNNANNDETPTQSQVDVASGTTPYTLGFRKALKMTNGNQTSGAGSGDRVCILYNMEAQDIAKSGWDYTSSSSFITIQFWVKASVSQNYYVLLRTRDGTERGYVFETGSLTADTWTKITKTVPGSSILQIDNDNGNGLQIEWQMFRGTDKTGSVTLNQWATFDGSARVPDMTSTWYTTNDATFEITGVQLEVGSAATPFEHRTHADELKRCSRYYQKIAEGNQKAVAFAFNYNTQYGDWVLQYPMGPMRTSPSIDMVQGSDYYHYHGGSQTCNLDGAFIIEQQQNTQANIYFDPDASLTAGGTGYIKTHNASAYFAISAEL